MTSARPTVATVLTHATDQLSQTYTAARITWPSVVRAIRRSARTLTDGCLEESALGLAAIDALDAYLPASFLASRIAPLTTVEVLAELRTAARDQQAIAAKQLIPTLPSRPKPSPADPSDTFANWAYRLEQADYDEVSV